MINFGQIQDDNFFDENCLDEQLILDYTKELSEENNLIDILSDCGGLNLYPSFNEVEKDLNVKKSYLLGCEKKSLK